RSVSLFKAIVFIANITLIHHFIVFTLEYFSFNEISTVFNKSIITTITTVILLIFGILLFTKKK
ncbi:MAG TPA: hypothetical protein VJ970_07385, partial [Flavobacteriaceae bacterium]|nr:hypothetical protein [Flavobacteriaceae bacterium]